MVLLYPVTSQRLHRICACLFKIFDSTIFFGPQKCWSQKKFRTKKGLEAKIINLKQDPVVNSSGSVDNRCSLAMLHDSTRRRQKLTD